MVVVEIVILAMIAAFLGLRLYSVLGRRAEHEEESIPTRFDPPKGDAPRVATPASPSALAPARPVDLNGAMPAVERGVRAIAAADRSFDITSFLAGARGAYGMVLEAFWNGDRATLRELCDDDVYASFDGAIAMREEAGETIESKLIRVEETKIHSASLDRKIARIAVMFVSDIASVTRDRDGNVVAGSLDDAIESRDIWTFSRDVSSASPDWVLDETDQA
ncbi:MAG: Tim44/TimA family putative adaptor protein [Sphingomonadaceae bacterium]